MVSRVGIRLLVTISGYFVTAVSIRISNTVRILVICLSRIWIRVRIVAIGVVHSLSVAVVLLIVENFYGRFLEFVLLIIKGLSELCITFFEEVTEILLPVINKFIGYSKAIL